LPIMTSQECQSVLQPSGGVLPGSCRSPCEFRVAGWVQAVGGARAVQWALFRDT
jgi:hypothetical protein